jgi:hypothetical protein
MRMQHVGLGDCKQRFGAHMYITYPLMTLNKHVHTFDSPHTPPSQCSPHPHRQLSPPCLASLHKLNLLLDRDGWMCEAMRSSLSFELGCTGWASMMIILLLFLQKQSLAFAVYLFGIGTLLTGLGLKKKHM